MEEQVVNISKQMQKVKMATDCKSSLFCGPEVLKPSSGLGHGH